MKTKVFTVLIFVMLSLACLQVHALENSIIPLMEKYETIENLPQEKFLKSQYNEIKKALLEKENKIRIVSFNMLCNLYDEKLPAVHRWPQRLERVVEVIQDMQPDLIGSQELHKVQLDDLIKEIGGTYEFYSKASEEGELNGIFYRRDRFQVLEKNVWPMNHNPAISNFETLTMLKLKDLLTGKIFAVFNAHLAFSKIEKRGFQARFIVKHLEKMSKQMPLLLTGDFNTFPMRPDLESLPFFDGDYIHRILTQGALRDARDDSLLGHLGPLATFTNAPEDVHPFKGLGTPGVFLDHIYVTKNITVLLQAVQTATVLGEFPSDHMPLIVDFIIQE